jgi:aminopeptidase N
MKWWNDLWLNESFADFMCFLCLSFISNKIPATVTDAWTNMLNEKAWGYEEDSRLNTHPIAGEVPNTSAADSIFDGITYSKGAAVLK